MLNDTYMYKTALQFLQENAENNPEKIIELFKEINKVNNINANSNI